MIKRMMMYYAPDEPPAGGVTITPAPATPEPPAPVTPVIEPPAATPEPTEPPTPAATPEPTEPDSQAGLKAAAAVERRKRQEAQEQARQAREEAAFLRGQLAAAAPAPAPEPAAPSGPPVAPKAEDFDSWDDFQSADRQYIIKLAEHNVLQRIEQRDQHQVQQRTQQETEARWEKQRTAAVTKYPDFQEVISNPAFGQSATVAEVIKSTDNGADVAYYLGTNLAEANRINAMPPLQAAMALGQIATTLANKPAPAPPRAVSQAPEPIATVPLGVSPPAFDPETASMSEYRAWRQSQMSPQRR